MSDGVFLTTPRLLICDRRPADLAFLASLYADPRVMRWIGDGRTYDFGEIEARYAAMDAASADGARPRWDAFKVLRRRDDGVAIGQAGLLRCEIDGAADVEIGWWLAPFAWGHGYATEAAIALRDYAFAELGLAQLSVVLHAENRQSVAVARRIGGVAAGSARYRGRVVTRYAVRAPGCNRDVPPAVEPQAMLKRDLTTSYPRSVREKTLGVVQLGRAIDKGIALANGLNGEYNFDCPMDRAVFGFLGVDGNALLDVIKGANSEAEIEGYLKPYVDAKSPREIDEFNTNFLVYAPEPNTPGAAYFLELRNQVAPDRTDVTAWADLLDLDEKRDVPKRVPVGA